MKAFGNLDITFPQTRNSYNTLQNNNLTTSSINGMKAMRFSRRLPEQPRQSATLEFVWSIKILISI